MFSQVGMGQGRGDNSNYNGYANYYAVTAVCAVSDQGIRSSTRSRVQICGYVLRLMTSVGADKVL